MIQNPVLRGFHPDPSIVRTGEDYYAATSTFEWWPGIRIHHSRNLSEWELIGYPLTRTSQLDLRGIGSSQGVWAPSLTWDDGIFYLVYTVVRSFYCSMYDTENFLVTAPDIRGPWSEPVRLNSFGFDPALFHDGDRKYMVSMVTDHRIPKKYAGRLILQEFDPVRRELTGPVREIFRSDSICLEGPHIFRRKDWYYLFCADTGTGELHGQTVLRSRSVWGPYEMYRPEDPLRREGDAFSVLTSRHLPECPLQKAGHADLVETQDGEWYAVHLCGRPVPENGSEGRRFHGSRPYMLGRETAVQKFCWTEDGWPVLANGTTAPDTAVPEPACARRTGWKPAPVPDRDDFEGETLSLEYQSLRVPMDSSHISLTARPGWLRMYGRSGLSSLFSQTLIARRVTEYRMHGETCLDFSPDHFKQMAGLILLYDIDNFLYLHVSRDEDMGKCIALLQSENRSCTYLTPFVPVEEGRDLVLALDLSGSMVQFSCGFRGGPLRPFGPETDASFLSDEACREGWFTGTMAGICCQDLTGAGKPADFDFFEVRALREPDCI